MVPGESWWSRHGLECFELFKTIEMQLWFKQGVAYMQSTRNAILRIGGHSWSSVEIVDNHNFPSMRIRYEYLKMGYGYSSIGLQVPRNVVMKFVVDRRSTMVLDTSLTVLARPHYCV